MKNLKTLFISAGFLLSSIGGFAQYIPGAFDYHEMAMQFSQHNLTGSARIQGIGGAQISLGGDISSVYSNPAGLGFYNRSEVTITPTLNFFNTNSSYQGESMTSNRGKFNFDNFGVVLNKSKDTDGWKGGSFGFSITKLNEFNYDIDYSGMNYNNDIIDYYVQEANYQNTSGDNLYGAAQNAYETFLISEFFDVYTDGSEERFYERTFFGEFPTSDYGTRQSEYINVSGGQSQWNISYGGNFDDVIYIGASLGLPTIRYDIRKSYREEYPGLSTDIVRRSNLIEDLEVDGYGINGTLGIILRPISQFTIGASVVTPTYYTMKEYYSNASNSIYNTFDMNNYEDYFLANYNLIANPDPGADYDYTTFDGSDFVIEDEYFESDLNYYEYEMTTPMKVSSGISYFFGKSGFITADVEWIDYKSMRLRERAFSMTEQNDIIRAMYKSVLNYRVGGEFRHENFRLRGGFAYKADPYRSAQIVDRSITDITAGIGYRSENFYLDLAAIFSNYKSVYYPYTLDNPDFESPVVDINNSNVHMVLSGGVLF